METIPITCPECERPMKAPADAVGKKIRCKGCEHVFVIEAPPAKDAITSAKKKAAPAKPAPPAKAIKAAKPTKAPAPAGEEDDSAGYGLTETEEGFRCPQCAAKMKNEDAVICLNCGYNKVTREQVRTRKVKAVTGGDKFLWLLPGILCVLAVLVLIGYCFFHHFALPGIVIDNWLELTETKSRMEALKDDSVEWWKAAILHPAIEVWIVVFIAFGCWKAGYFAVQRLIYHPDPPEIEEK